MLIIEDTQLFLQLNVLQPKVVQESTCKTKNRRQCTVLHVRFRGKVKIQNLSFSTYSVGFLSQSKVVYNSTYRF